ncbi:TetR/AcrR family transcriptional regulator [Saccharopolyspora sp. NPDC002686]|uniref:TetR/AcrR family transcriptional regulator n=1 Tax=Saccharopolyspora sp. NPDC002686 TaxID=3154541 RepID=UPI0033313E85
MTVENSPPGSVRPRGRTERVRQAVVAATHAQFRAHGYPSLTVERVAEAAGVAKSTVYRRWRDTAGLLLEVLREMSGAQIPLVDTGSVDEDLRQLAVSIVRVYSDSENGPMVLAMIAEAVHDPRVADELRAFWRDRNENAADAVRRGIRRGELPADTDPVDVIRTLAAPLYYRMLVTHEPVDETIATRAAAAALAAARAGALDTAG